MPRSLLAGVTGLVWLALATAACAGPSPQPPVPPSLQKLRAPISIEMGARPLTEALREMSRQSGVTLARQRNRDDHGRDRNGRPDGRRQHHPRQYPGRDHCGKLHRNVHGGLHDDRAFLGTGECRARDVHLHLFDRRQVGLGYIPVRGNRFVFRY